MLKYALVSVLMVGSLVLAFYAISQIEYYDRQRFLWHEKANTASSEQERNDSLANASEAYHSSLVWGSLGVLGSGGALSSLLFMLYLVIRSDRVKQEGHDGPEGRMPDDQET